MIIKTDNKKLGEAVTAFLTFINEQIDSGSTDFTTLIGVNSTDTFVSIRIEYIKGTPFNEFQMIDPLTLENPDVDIVLTNWTETVISVKFIDKGNKIMSNTHADTTLEICRELAADAGIAAVRNYGRKTNAPLSHCSGCGHNTPGVRTKIKHRCLVCGSEKY